MSQAVFYGIGVGPGDPELVTVKAARVLGRMRAVFAAASSRNTYSLALEAARPYLAPEAEVRELAFPMLRERKTLERAWQENARRVAAALVEGGEAAFLTLGDPLIYSTFGYLMRILDREFPKVDVRVIPGITSFQAAAARTRTVLCEGEENLLLLSGIADGQALEKDLEYADNAVILKACRNWKSIREALTRTGRVEQSLFISRLGLPGETAVHLAQAPENPPYLSLVLTK